MAAKRASALLMAWSVDRLGRSLQDLIAFLSDLYALKQAIAAYELDAFKPNLTRAEADLRIAALAAKLKLLGEPPHTL